MNDKNLKTSTPTKRRTKPKKKIDSHRIVDECEILDGAVKLIRTTKSGQFWSMSCWLREEGKCFRRSMRTRNLDEAKELARDKYFELKSDIRSGHRIFSKTAEELVNDFVKYKQDEAYTGIITEGRVQTIKISLNRWLLKYIGHKQKLEKISRHDFS